MSADDLANASASAPPVGLRRLWVAALALFVAAFALYGPTTGFEFIPFDDNVDVYENPWVLDGLSAESIRWAWTADLFEDSEHANYWMPLNFLSHMLVVELAGSAPGAHHFANVLLHAVNSVLLLLLLVRLAGTRHFAVAVFASVLFVVHPVHVESVAWVTERKDVLSGSFFFGALLTYLGWTQHRGIWRYCLLVLLMAAGLCVKPMLVTLPFILLAIDRWIRQRPWSVRGVVLKLPLFALALASGIITIAGHARVDAAVSVDQVSIAERASAAVCAYLAYLELLFWPRDLAILYPLDPRIDVARTSLAVAVFATLTVFAWRAAGRARWFAFGWFWFVVILLPVSGIAQAGNQAHADRFLYLPAIGIYWIVAQALFSTRSVRTVQLGVGASVALTLALLTVDQVRLWRDGETLFEATLERTQGNHRIHFNLGTVYFEQRDFVRAGEHIVRAAELRPNFAPYRTQLASLHLSQERYAQALTEATAATELDPSNLQALFALGLASSALDHPARAEAAYARILERDPAHLPARMNLAALFARRGAFKRAIAQYRTVLEHDARNASALKSLGSVYANTQRWSEAVEALERAYALEPTPQTSKLLERARAQRDRTQ